MSKPSPFTVTKDGLSYRVELDVHYISEAEMQTLRKYITTLNDENDKLRELVRELYDELDAATQYDAGGGRGVVHEFANRMRELGVEP